MWLFSSVPIPSVHTVSVFQISGLRRGCPECFCGCCSCGCLCLSIQTVSSGNSLRPDTKQTSVACAHALPWKSGWLEPRRSPHSNDSLHRTWPHCAFKFWIRQTRFKENIVVENVSTLLQLARNPILKKTKVLLHD